MQPRSNENRLTLLEQTVSQLETTTIPALREEMNRCFDAVDRRFEALEQRLQLGFEETGPAPARRTGRNEAPPR